MLPKVMTFSCKKIHASVTIACLVLVTACAPTRPPVDELDAASRALGVARDAGAATDATDDYRSAGRRFDDAQLAESKGDYQAAADLALESQVISELAAARARLARERREVKQLELENARLEQGLQRDGSLEDRP